MLCVSAAMRGGPAIDENRGKLAAGAGKFAAEPGNVFVLPQACRQFKQRLFIKQQAGGGGQVRGGVREDGREEDKAAANKLFHVFSETLLVIRR